MKIIRQGRGQFGTVKKMKHKETGYIFAVKMINDDLMESNDRRNSEIMDLEAPLKFGGVKKVLFFECSLPGGL